jgi:hypothetical protein
MVPHSLRAAGWHHTVTATNNTHYMHSIVGLYLCGLTVTSKLSLHEQTNAAILTLLPMLPLLLLLLYNNSPSVKEPPEEPPHRLLRILVRCAGLNTAPLSGKKRANTLIAQFPTDTKLSCERAVTRQSSSSAMLAVHPNSRARGSGSSGQGRGPPVRNIKDYSNKGSKKASGSSGSAAKGAAKGAAKKKKAIAPVRLNV